VADLRKRGLIGTCKGAGAGIWLLPEGMAAAKALQSYLPPQKME